MMISCHYLAAIFSVIAFLLLPMNCVAQDSTEYKSFIEISNRSFKFARVIGKQDIYFVGDFWNQVDVYDEYETQDDSIVTDISGSVGSTGGLRIGLGYDRYWGRPDLKMGIREEISISIWSISKQWWKHVEAGTLYNYLAFIAEKSFQDFSVGVAYGPEISWESDHGEYTRDGEYYRWHTDTFITNMMGELFVRLYF